MCGGANFGWDGKVIKLIKNNKGQVIVQKKKSSPTSGRDTLNHEKRSVCLRVCLGVCARTYFWLLAVVFFVLISDEDNGTQMESAYLRASVSKLVLRACWCWNMSWQRIIRTLLILRKLLWLSNKTRVCLEKYGGMRLRWVGWIVLKIIIVIFRK